MLLKKFLFIVLMFLGLLVFGQDSLKKHTNVALGAEPALQDDHTVFPVIYKMDTLFGIAAADGDLSAKERAEKITKRIKVLGKDYNESKDSIYLREGKAFVDVMYNHELAFSIIKADADAKGTSIGKLAKETRDIFAEALYKHKYHLSAMEWAKRVLFTFLSLIVLIVLLWVIKFLFNKLDKRLMKFDRSLLKKRNNLFKYFIPKNTKNIFVFISHSVKVVLIIVLLFVYLPLLFGFLPWTQGLVEVFYGYIETPILFAVHGFINFIPHLFFIVIILYITRYFVRVMHDMFDDIDEEKLKFKNFPRDWAVPTRKLFTVILYAFGAVMIFPHLPGSDSPAFKGVSLFLGVLFSLGSTSAIANMVAGIVITYMRPFQIGDRVEVMGVVGNVVDKTLLITRIRTAKNEDVTIPNAAVISNHLINFSANASDTGLILHTEITIGYDVPWRDIEKYLLKAAKGTKLLQRDPKPFVLQTSLDDNYVTYELNVYTKQPKKTPAIMSDLNSNILDVFDEVGIEILSPKYVASRDGNMSTVPSQKGHDLRNPLEKIADHLTGRNQKIKVEKASEKSAKAPANETKKKAVKKKP